MQADAGDHCYNWPRFGSPIHNSSEVYLLDRGIFAMVMPLSQYDANAGSGQLRLLPRHPGQPYRAGLYAWALPPCDGKGKGAPLPGSAVSPTFLLSAALRYVQAG